MARGRRTALSGPLLPAMRVARLAILAVALSSLASVAGAADVDRAPRPSHTCAPATNPSVVFPFSAAVDQRSGRGAILWLGGAPSAGGAAAAGTTLDIASLHSDDLTSLARTFSHGLLALAGRWSTAWTWRARSWRPSAPPPARPSARATPAARWGRSTPLGGPGGLVATADGYIGDAVVVNTVRHGGQQLIELRPQRHYDGSFASARCACPSASGADRRAVRWRWTSAPTRSSSGLRAGRLRAMDQQRRARPRGRTLGPTGYAPQLAAVLSDNNHAFVMWTDEPAPGAPGVSRIYLDHSGNNVTFGPHPHTLAAFAEPPGSASPPTRSRWCA